MSSKGMLFRSGLCNTLDSWSILGFEGRRILMRPMLNSDYFINLTCPWFDTITEYDLMEITG